MVVQLMRKRISVFDGIALFLAVAVFAPTLRADQPAISYPKAKKGETVDEYHGVKISDPYRWLEDADTPESKAWIEAENKITFGFLEQIPQREQIKNRLTNLWNFERYGIPF